LATGASGISIGVSERGSLAIKEECWWQWTVIHTAAKPAFTGTLEK